MGSERPCQVRAAFWSLAPIPVAITSAISHQPSKQRTLRLSGYIQGSTSVGTRGAGKTTPASDGVRMPLSDMRSFLELEAGHLHCPWGYDEPEIPRYSNRQFGPIGADAGHAERLLRQISTIPISIPARGVLSKVMLTPR